MVRIESAGGLTKVFATTSTKKSVLLAFGRAGQTAQRGLRLYDIGDGNTYTSRFTIGCGPERSYKLADAPAKVVKAFKDAGMKQPTVWNLRAIGYAYRFAHWAHRGMLAGMNRVDHPRARHQ